ncbi:hypothetical protein GGR16_002392 [Chelatococcus caeni]|uniref:Uncharacterized protein n=1 Tax=Chelatococcus caeni TaxID=1348468 RepID=A0A840BXT7_9HYPH|nr:hypothetical protein [Chelatococcus caeni]MBB4017363.1 hypothetical protein [Chelatococcus caeni]
MSDAYGDRKRRLMRASFLAGRGLRAADIAADPVVASTPDAVRQFLRRAGISVQSPDGGTTICITAVTPATVRVLDLAAKARGITRCALVYRLIESIGHDTRALDLISNILDDAR